MPSQLHKDALYILARLVEDYPGLIDLESDIDCADLVNSLIDQLANCCEYMIVGRNEREDLVVTSNGRTYEVY